MKKVAIVQSCYIPWKGYFDQIAAVDEFILYDDMQFTRRDWRNRNLIKTPQGLQWLTVPVKVKGKYTQTIRETEIQGPDWAEVHWRTLRANYARAPHFEEIAALLKPIYRENHTTISALNRRFTEAICGYLGIGTTLRNSWEYSLAEGKSERLADLCRQAGATTYVSGPAAKNYLDESAFTALGLTVEWFNYDDYPSYPQLWGEFNHGISIVDLLFNCGTDAPHSMKYVSRWTS
ncbi:WbqC family protein [Mesorhizobium sp. A623]